MNGVQGGFFFFFFSYLLCLVLVLAPLHTMAKEGI